ncbi:MAG TPA: S53 family peptidase [Solirubrobacteraceae bacterium]|jgi:kumamolisin|nr:S53 family peptidase [Solirubrobacteraceae bacterium]
MAITSRGSRSALARVVVVLAAGLSLVALCGVPGARAATGRSGVSWVGAAPSGRAVSLVLPLNANVAGLQKLATAVATPGSPRYGQYESIATLAQRFGASSAERSRVTGYLHRAGATGVKIDVTGLFADATMKVSVAHRLFGAALGDFHSARAGLYMAPSSAVSIPAALRSSVTGVVGLDTQPVFGGSQVQRSTDAAWPHKAAMAAPARETTDDESGYLQRTGTAAGCGAATSQTGFTPNQYLTAYNYAPLQAAGIEGQGERVALIEIDGFRFSDLRRFANCFGLATPEINGYGVGLKHPLSPGGESTLDLEVLDAAAPKLKAVDVYESRPSAVDVLHSLTAPLGNAGAKPDVISASLGSCEPATLETIGNSGLRSVEGALALASASGISVLASSGDDGSSACLTPDGKPLPGLAVSYPASSPFVTGVGGTNISLNAANQITSQDVWNDSPLVVAAGGGGLSGLFNRPAYQTTFVAPNHRAVPDVSMLADVAPGYEIYCTAKGDCISGQDTNPWTQVGGTSAAAPLLAGGLALIDQQLRTTGHQNLGLANPLLYAIDHSPSAPNVISDVTANDNDLGDNIIGRPFGCCTALPGYDEASGLGSVNLAGLASVAQVLVPKIVTVGVSLPTQGRPVAAEHLLARVSCSGQCLMGAYVHLQLGRSRNLMTQQSNAYVLHHGGRKTIRIPFDKTTLTKLRAAVAKGQRITAIVYGVILDPNGTIESRTAGARMRIRH